MARSETVEITADFHDRQLYDHAPVAYFFYTPDGIIQRINRAACELTGFAEHELVGRSHLDMAPETPEARAAFERELRRGVERGSHVTEVQGRLKDGSIRWVRVTLRAIHDAEGGLRGMAVIAVDVEDLKRAEQELREREALYRDLYEDAPLAYMVLGPDGLFRQWNARVRELTGYSDDELRGRHCLDLLSDTPEALATFEAMRREVFDRGADFAAEVEGRRRDGSRYWVRCTVRPIRDAHGRVAGGRSISEDVTQWKRAEQAVRDSEARLAGVIGSAMDAIVSFDGDGRIVLFNPAAERIFRCTAAQAIGMPVLRLTTDAAGASMTRAMRAIEAGEERYGFSEPGLRALRTDGEEFEFEASLSRAEAGGRTLYTIILRDVEERRRAAEDHARLQRQAAYLQEEINQAHNFEDIVGRSRPLLAALERVDLVAPTDSTVLILGETGTGKELVARAIHSRSGRRAHPLIKVNCAALPTGLIESELFGHEKGSFTGATERRVGRFELAHRGTIFLDEIGELPLDMQVKLLRVLQEQQFERLGGSTTMTVDVRVIAATNRDLAAMVAAGTFRADLYYRLNVFPLRLPPLRERSEDVAMLVHHFVRRYAKNVGRQITRVPEPTLAALVAYDWPGNIRELQNVVERAVILSAGPDLAHPAELAGARAPGATPLAAVATPAPASPRPDAADGTLDLRDVERRHVFAVLEQTGWSIEGAAGAARVLGLSPSTLRSRMQRLGIRRPPRAS